MTALPKPKREKDSSYLEYIREHACVVRLCEDRFVDAHHVTAKGHGKVGSKASDKNSVPLCRFHHDLFHVIGLDEFESRFGLILNYEILRLQRAYKPPVKAKRERAIGIVGIDVRCRCVQKTHHFPPSKVIHTETGLYWQCPILRERIEVE